MTKLTNEIQYGVAVLFCALRDPPFTQIVSLKIILNAGDCQFSWKWINRREGWWWGDQLRLVLKTTVLPVTVAMLSMDAVL